MKKLFGKHKKEEGKPAPGSGTPPPTATATATATPSGAVSSGSVDRYGCPVTPSCSTTDYLQTPGGSTGRISGPGRSVSRTLSGMSSGRRSARRPREFIDLSQPEQVDGSREEDGSWEGSEDNWEEGDPAAASVALPCANDPGVAATEQEQIDADLALAYWLAMQYKQQKPPPVLHPQLPHHLPVQHSMPVQQQHLRQRQPPSGLSSLSLGLPPHSSLSTQSNRSEDIALVAALAESQFAARQQAEMARQQDSLEAQYQAAISHALEESMMTINYDNLLRDIQLWIFDLEGATGDVNKALQEAGHSVEEINRQMAEADPEDVEGWHRIMWLSEQYPLVEERLREVRGRVAPVNTAVKELKDLCEYIRVDQPPLADAEAVRDKIIASLFEGLSSQGLDANHPFSAYGDQEEGQKPGRVGSLLSMGSDKSADKDKAPRGGDLRDVVRQLIEEAKRIPEPPPLPLKYEELLAGLQCWIDDCEAANHDVDAAVQDVRQQHDSIVVLRDEAVEDPFDENWHCLAFLSEQYSLAEGRLHRMLTRIAPTSTLAQSLRDLKQRIEKEKPLLADAEAVRNVAISALFSGLAGQGLDTASLPPAPDSSNMRDIVRRAIEEAKRILQVPPVPINYSGVELAIREWIEQLEATSSAVADVWQEVKQAREENDARKATGIEDIFDFSWHRLAWLSKQYPLAEARVQEVGSQAAHTGPTIQSLHALQQQIKDEKPPLEEVQEGLEVAVSVLLASLATRGLNTASLPTPTRGSDVRGMIGLALEEARRIPLAPPVPINYSGLQRNIQEWIEQLEATSGDLEAAQQETSKGLEDAVAQQAVVTEKDREAWHRISWLCEQFPLAAVRLEAVGNQLAPTSTAIQSLHALQQRIEYDKPPLEEVEEGLKGAVSTLLAGLSAKGLNTASLPTPPHGSDVREMIGQALEEAMHIPVASPVPINYSSVLLSIQEWIEQLEATSSNVEAAQQETKQKREQNDTEKAAATEDIYEEGYHRLAWLSQQYPLAESRLQMVAAQVAPCGPAIRALCALQQRIENDNPALEEVQAGLDAAVGTLVVKLAAKGLSLPSTLRGSDVREMVRCALEAAKRIPALPPVPTNYGGLLNGIQQWIDDLEGTSSDVAIAQQETKAAHEAASAEKAQMEENIFDEAYHHLAFLSKEYPLAEVRLRKVASQIQPSSAAIQALKELKDRVETEKPSLEEGQEALDAVVGMLLADLGRKRLKVAALVAPVASGDIRGLVCKATDRARRLPTVPLPAVRPTSLQAPPSRSPRMVEPPRFNPPNLTVPRSHKKSRGIKPSPEDAIKRDPRVITLYNELSKGCGIVAETVAWDAVSAEVPAGSSPVSDRRASARGAGSGTPGSARSATASPANPKAMPSPWRASASADSPAAAVATPEPEMSEEEAAAYLPTLPARGAAVAAFEPQCLQDVADFVSDIRAQGGDAPRSGHADAAFPTARWRVMVEVATVFDQLVDMCDTLAKWQCDAQATVISESHRLAAYVDGATAAAARVMYPHDSLRVRMQKAGLPWDAALLTDQRWASQHAGAALMLFSLDQVEGTIRAKGWNTGAVLQLLGSAAIAAFKVHQFCGGFNQECARIYDQLHERTVHYARMVDPLWLRSTKWA